MQDTVKALCSTANKANPKVALADHKRYWTSQLLQHSDCSEALCIQSADVSMSLANQHTHTMYRSLQHSSFLQTGEGRIAEGSGTVQTCMQSATPFLQTLLPSSAISHFSLVSDTSYPGLTSVEVITAVKCLNNDKCSTLAELLGGLAVTMQTLQSIAPILTLTHKTDMQDILAPVSNKVAALSSQTTQQLACTAQQPNVIACMSTQFNSQLLDPLCGFGRQVALCSLWSVVYGYVQRCTCSVVRNTLVMLFCTAIGQPRLAHTCYCTDF